MLEYNGKDLKDKRVVISGSGNVAIYAAEKAQQYGAKVVVMSDSAGYIRDEKGIDVELIKELKEVKRVRIKEYLNKYPEAVYVENQKAIWEEKCDIALPCATQNDIDLESAKKLVANGVLALGEGANMPSTNDALNYFLDNEVLVAPAKAANAGGVATSALEMSQNSIRYNWTFEEVDKKLHDIMINIHKEAAEASKEYGLGYNLVAGANIAGFKKVADAMIAQGDY
jgi:glutamate dehydrogenase (NADP+)